ncbi:putative isomerase YbhE [Annulohypoxylon maeteangense]|uniref:putative isomerase YbhE n=1 Tax=Annulohypoxylon maeteangense TaxID=1927788 RepID=UPI002007DA3B|nr:putative isomerase YbhE [Annulohypoxylon maeteangense]KAI0887646.1 putative isomerase YbhE [Annulohypoxylon maeteangense]
MNKLVATFLTLTAMASATPTKRSCKAPTTTKLVIGAPFQILTANFDGKKFSITGNHTEVGAAPSWILNRDPNTFYAVNENSNDLSLFTLDTSLSKINLASSVNGSSGVVFLEFNSDKTRMIGAAYGNATVDVWDVSAADHTPKLLKTVPVPGTPSPAQGAHHPHQALLDPTGRFFVINNLGGDTVLVLDSKDDKFEFTGNATLPTGTGPRHGGFITNGDKHYYTLVSELSNKLFLFELKYTADTIVFNQLQVQSTYGGAPPANASSAAAGELQVAANQRDVYVSNRISGNETDSIAHFVFNKNGTSLDWAETISTGGLRPRMFSLSTDRQQTMAFVANQGGAAGLAAFKRSPDSGKLDPTPVATMPYSTLVAPALAATDFMGPQFVQQI